MPDYVSTCEDYARAAGEVLRQWQGRISAREKAPADLVSEADLASQRLIQRRIACDFPEHGFLGEEEEFSQTSPNDYEYCWIVDPLDGTTNYVHGLTGWCVSIGLSHNGKALAGCVYDPDRDLCYTAARGEGAHCNGQPLRVSDTTALHEALVAVSFPAGVERNSPNVESFLKLLPAVRAFRRLGSAALNLCYVASGQLDAYWTGSIHPWDAAAGLLMVEEAGGVASTATGETVPLELRSLIVAATPQLQRNLVKQIN